MRFLRLLYILPLLTVLQCEDDAPPVPDQLDETGLLGRWEIEDETINGISDLLPKCCKFFEFSPDNIKDDTSAYSCSWTRPVNILGSLLLIKLISR